MKSCHYFFAFACRFAAKSWHTLTVLSSNETGPNGWKLFYVYVREENMGDWYKYTIPWPWWYFIAQWFKTNSTILLSKIPETFAMTWCIESFAATACLSLDLRAILSVVSDGSFVCQSVKRFWRATACILQLLCYRNGLSFLLDSEVNLVYITLNAPFPLVLCLGY